jgi:lysophospholipase L1-like esterase
MRSWVFLLALLVPSSAFGATVMAYGDSTTRGDQFRPHEAWPTVLGTLRPDLVVVNEGKAGDPSDNLTRFTDALDTHAPEVVVLMLGTNDPVCEVGVDDGCVPHATPDRTLRNLWRMALTARRRGAEVFVLTQTPALWVYGRYCDLNPDADGCPDRERLEALMVLRQAHTRQVAEGLVAWRPRRRIRVLNLRDEFTTTNWRALAADGLHPNGTGNRLIAEYLARALP